MTQAAWTRLMCLRWELACLSWPLPGPYRQVSHSLRLVTWMRCCLQHPCCICKTALRRAVALPAKGQLSSVVHLPRLS